MLIVYIAFSHMKQNRIVPTTDTDNYNNFNTMPADIQDKILMEIINGNDTEALKNMLATNTDMRNRIKKIITNNIDKFDDIHIINWDDAKDVLTTIILHFLKTQYDVLSKKNMENKTRIEHIVVLEIGIISVRTTMSRHETRGYMCTIVLVDASGKWFVFNFEPGFIKPGSTPLTAITNPYMYEIMVNGDIANSDEYYTRFLTSNIVQKPTLRNIVTAMLGDMISPGSRLLHAGIVTCKVFSNTIYASPMYAKLSYFKKMVSPHTNYTLFYNLLLKNAVDVIRENNVPQTVTNAIIYARSQDMMNSVMEKHVRGVEPRSGGNGDVRLTMPLLGYNNAMLMHAYEKKTGTPSIILMRFYNDLKFNLEVSNYANQARIHKTLTTWKENGFEQPLFTQEVADFFNKPSPSNNNFTNTLDARYEQGFGVYYKHQTVASTDEQSNLLHGEILQWISSGLQNDGMRKHTINTIDVFPLLPIGTASGGFKSTNSYKRTRQYSLYKNKKHVIYTGKRGGEYLYIAGKYVSVKKLK
jgi:hypothetical protein